MPFVSSSSGWAEPAARGSPRVHSSLCTKVASPQESWWGPHFTQIVSRGLFAAPDLFFFPLMLIQLFSDVPSAQGLVRTGDIYLKASYGRVKRLPKRLLTVMVQA